MAKSCSFKAEQLHIPIERQAAALTEFASLVIWVPQDGLKWMERLVESVKVPGLSEYGVSEEHVADVCEKSAVSSSMQGNPVKLTLKELAEVLKAAL